MNAERLLDLYDRVADAPDAIGRLRRFVLDLAVRGKLVEQDPTDEPATELLKQIAAAQARLLKAGGVRRQKPSAPIGQKEMPVRVPNRWTWIRLRDVGTLTGGMTPSKNRPEYWGGEVVWFSPKDIKADFVSDSGLKITKKALSDTRLKLFPPGSLFLVARSGILKRTFPVAINGAPAASNQDLKVLVPFLEGMERYLQLMFGGLTPFILGSLVKTGTTVQSLKYAEFAIQPVPLPPLAEQRRIVAKVDELFALCDRLEETRAEREDTRDRLTKASLARLTAPDTDEPTFRGHARFAIHALPALTTRADQVEHLRQTILSLAVRGKLVEQDPADEPASKLLERIDSARKLAPTKGRKTKRVAIPSWLADTAFSPPTDWAHARLSQLVRVLNGRAYKKAELLDSGTPVLRVGNLFTSKHWYYSDLRLAEDKYCDEGDLLYAWSASFGPVIWQGPRAIFHYHIWKLSLFSEADLDKRFLYYFLLQQTQEIKSAGHGISMVHMTKGKMERLAVPVPPLAEQDRIVAKVDELMALCDRLEEARFVSEGTRDRLLDSLLHEARRAADATAERPTQFNWLPEGRHD